MPFAQQVLALRELSCPNRLTRDELAYILDTFPIMRRKDERAVGGVSNETDGSKQYDEQRE